MENQMKAARGGPDVLDLDNSELVGGGGVGDTYCEDAASENQAFTPWSRNVARHAIITTFSLLFTQTLSLSHCMKV